MGSIKDEVKIRSDLSIDDLHKYESLLKWSKRFAGLSNALFFSTILLVVFLHPAQALLSFLLCLGTATYSVYLKEVVVREACE